MSNLKQMSIAWIMYATDHGGVLVSNRPYAGTPGIPTDNWVAGVMDWTTNSQNTDEDLLLQAGLSPYLKSPAIYKCPADESVSAAGPRVRSYSMNAFMGSSGQAVGGWRHYLKLEQISPPAATFVFVGEHPNSIDDGYFVNDPNRTNVWVDLPASGHKGAGGLGFADGHSEIHRWSEASTKQHVKPNGPKPAVRIPRRGTGADLAWVLERTTQRETNSAGAP